MALDERVVRPGQRGRRDALQLLSRSWSTDLPRSLRLTIQGAHGVLARMQEPSFKPISELAVVSLKSEIELKRDVGEVLMRVSSIASDAGGADVTELVDAFAEHVGCIGLREEWTRLGRDQAKLLLVRILARDLAYNATIMAAEHAERLAQRFLDLFPAKCRFFSNTVVTVKDEDLSVTRSGYFAPITNAAFDTGVIAVSEHRIGMLWVKDED